GRPMLMLGLLKLVLRLWKTMAKTWKLCLIRCWILSQRRTRRMSLNDWLAPKQLKVLHSYLHDDFDMMILVGAIRSGKTFIDNLLFIYELRRTARLAKANRDKHPQYILAGATSDSIHKNVIVSCE